MASEFQTPGAIPPSEGKTLYSFPPPRPVSELNDEHIRNMIDEQLRGGTSSDESSGDSSSDTGEDSDSASPPTPYSLGPCCLLKIESDSKESLLCDCFFLSAFTGVVAITALTILVFSLLVFAQPDPHGFWSNFIDLEEDGTCLHIKPGEDPEERVVKQLLGADGGIEIIGVYKREALAGGLNLSATAVLKLMLQLALLLMVGCATCYVIFELVSIFCTNTSFFGGGASRKARKSRRRRGSRCHHHHHRHHSRRRRRQNHSQDGCGDQRRRDGAEWV